MQAGIPAEFDSEENRDSCQVCMIVESVIAYLSTIFSEMEYGLL